MSCKCEVKLYVGNSNVLQLGTTNSPLTNTITDTVDTGATVTSTITLAADGTEITGESWPVTLSHNSGGIYQYTLADDIALTEHYWYDVEISATGSGGEKGKWNARVKAEARKCE